MSTLFIFLPVVGSPFYHLQGAEFVNPNYLVVATNSGIPVAADMYSFRGVLLLVAAVLPSASAQSVCQTGWTQAPPSSDWGNKCYREFGPVGPSNVREGGSDPSSGGYTRLGCDAACKNDSATGRMLCLASEAEMTFVAKQAYMKGRVAFTQDSSRLDYAEPAGGWGWECGSTYVPSWSIDGDNGVQPSNTGEGDGFVACAKMTHAGTPCSCFNPTRYFPGKKHQLFQPHKITV